MAVRSLVFAACVAVVSAQVTAVEPATGATLVPNVTATTPVTTNATPVTVLTDEDKTIEKCELGVGEEAKSKLAMALFQLFSLGLCGIDRCYMGSICLGFAKGCTCGGLFVWALIDMVVILINCFDKKPCINSVGYEAVWSDDNLDIPYYVAIATVVLMILQNCGGAHAASQKAGGKSRNDEMLDDDASSGEDNRGE
eukprot:TRINITY_DN2865_c0_g1_i1.p1 TRINITY_DN2865_c0_g1~~TRINITY_DN2865_c0_g1_i1.p1  ORF type:complete len:197 (-),score=43.67 TRINITY_DN2865_c0_g1_i1:226-816(-)